MIRRINRSWILSALKIWKSIRGIVGETGFVYAANYKAECEQAKCPKYYVAKLEFQVRNGILTSSYTKSVSWHLEFSRGSYDEMDLATRSKRTEHKPDWKQCQK